MKKIVAFILITLYSFAMAGTTIAMHYCMGEKVSTTLGFSDKSICEFCHMDKHTGDDVNHCCKDENQFLKVTIDQDIAAFAHAPQIPVSFVNIFRFTGPCLISGMDKLPDYCSYIDPPDIPVYQRNCNFRI